LGVAERVTPAAARFCSVTTKPMGFPEMCRKLDGIIGNRLAPEGPYLWRQNTGQSWDRASIS